MADGSEPRIERRVVRPPLRWAGSKRQIVGRLGELWNPAYQRYVEPFVGSACLFFHLQPPTAVLGDRNPHLIQLYQQIRDNVEAVIHHLKGIPLGRESYYQVRAQFADGSPPALAAARFLFLNRNCFNGIFRTNRAGKFNVPYGGGRAGALPSEIELRYVSELLSGAKFCAGDFENTLAHCRVGDFVYLDPPYHSSTARVFSEYTAEGFNATDVGRLRSSLAALHDKGVKFALSYADNEEGKMLGEGYVTATLTVRRNVAGFTASRRMSTEVLITNA